MGTKRLRESFAAPLSSGTVDRAAGIVRGVLVCGTTSANGRSYPWGKGLTCDPRKYEGRPVNADHGKMATIDRKIGWLANVTVDASGRPRADLHILRSHPMAERVFEAAERNPSLFGLSHVAVCRTRMERGTEVIEDVQSVESVDLVADPATTKGLYEGTMPTTFKKFLESVGTAKHGPRCRKWAASKIVREMDEMMGDMPADMPPPPTADMAEPDGDDAVTAAFKAAIASIGDQLLAASGDPAQVKELANKIKKLAMAHGDINGDGKVDAADVDAADDTEDAEDLTAAESKGVEKGKALVYKAVRSVQASGLPVNARTLRLAESVPAADLPELLKIVRESATGEKPKTSGRTTTVTESKSATDAAPPPDAKTIVSYFRG